MATTFLYRCPNTRQTVQGWSAEDVSDDDEYESIACLACAQLHLINLKTGKVLGGRKRIERPGCDWLASRCPTVRSRNLFQCTAEDRATAEIPR
jgi:hypothetical protein